MEDLNKLLVYCHENIGKYFIKNKIHTFYDDECNFAFDIECCPTDETKQEMYTYSLSFMSCDIQNNVCYNFDDVRECLNTLLSLPCKVVNLYAHNCGYDMKPVIIDYIEQFGNNVKLQEFYTTNKYDRFEKTRKELKYCYNGRTKTMKPFQYDITMKDGIFYKLTLMSETTTINFYDTYKLVPYSLKKCCQDFLGLDLGKDGLDYEKIRKPGEQLTSEEKKYIYDDVFGLSYLVKALKIDGLTLSGKTFKFTKLTNSGQSLHDYKVMLLHDFLEKRPPFDDKELYQEVENRLMLKTKFYQKDLLKDEEEMAKMVFLATYPTESYFQDSWERHSYYGGLCTVHKENVEKYSKRKNKEGRVYDVNSLYPSRMKDCLLPYGNGNFSDKAYEEMSKEYKKNYPLYIQEITIYSLDVKKNKMAWLQIKDNPKFNGSEVQNNNIVNNERVTIKLRLTNVLLDLLFECYDVHSYELGGHVGFHGAYNLFKTYIDFWSEIKTTQKGAGRNLAKLRLNGLYGKFGMCGNNEITYIDVNNGKFEIVHTHDEIISETIYLPIASFITSYAKEKLVKAINANYKIFMYCDTDSIHLYGHEVKGIEIHDSKFGAWAHEMTFSDFKYLGAKRYAEKDINTGEWEIKCCGLTDNIMKKVDNIDVFDICKLDNKEIEKYKNNTLKDSVYYYYDKECTKPIPGLIKSNKMKIVKYGSCMIEQPYKITERVYFK